ncbi:MAG: NAD-dependent DNA ligase LigA [Ruminococcus sp.]|uniref:NAD-dependent DNA ligase LigA n=1 Tax=Ruminococcus sp. TaxID=41978 RepID=UPI0039919702
MQEKNNTNLERMRELIEQLTEADIAYYKNDAPIMTDLEYDRLTEELAALEHDTGLVLSGSPTQKVSGEILESLAEVRHTKPMLSAGKTKSIEDLIRFAAGRAVLLNWKMDGLTLVLRYEYGKLKQAITRGREGIIGEDVTHTVRTFRNVPLTIPTKESFEVRGEGVISWESFRRINASLEEPYTHPRNLASGSTRKLDAGEASKRRLEFWAFELVSDHLEPESKLAQQQFLQRSGFSVVPYIFLDAGHSGQDIRDTVAGMEPKDFAYPVDGLVMEYEDLRYGKSLGATGHHENRLIALKWADELYSTRFRGVELATTRTGMVSITGLFDPVNIDGTLVGRAYLHNLDVFDEFQFGIGDKIRVYKANMIIPQIADNKTQSNTYMLPMTCPCCGKPLTVKCTSGGTRQLYCGNPHCAAKLVQKFAHFCEKTRMNIEGLSATTLEKLIGHGWVHNFGDLYELERHREEIIKTEGFGEKSFERLQAAIEKSRCCTLAKFIAGLGIPMVGRHAGRDLDRYFHGSWAEFEAAILNGFDFTQLPDFGETMHNNIYTWYADAQEAKLWRPLLRKIQFETKENLTMETTMNNPFAGKTVVATGKLEHYTRDGIQEKLISLGAHPSGAVSKKTDYLIVGEKAGSKLTKAQQLGVKTLTEQEFEDMLA